MRCTHLAAALLLLLPLATTPVAARPAKADAEDAGLETAADAAPPADRDEEEQSSEPSTFEEAVTVTAPASDYAAAASSTATKTSTPLVRTPQAVTVVTGELVEDTGAQGLQDALNYAAGVRSDAFGLDSRTDSMLVRGGYPDTYLDGMRQHFNYYTSTTRTDPYVLERIEVLRGPSSMLYGQGTTAGVVNLVSKQPRAVTSRELDLQLGSFDRQQARLDFTGPLSSDGRWLYRLVAVGRDAGTQVDHVPDDRALFAPSLTWRPGDDTVLTFQLHWQKDESGSTLQFFPWSGSGAPNPNGPIPTDTFVGEPGFDRYDSERLSVGWLFEHRFGGTWRVRQNVRWIDNEVDYRTIYADAFTDPGDSFLDEEQREIGRIAWLSNPNVRMVTADQHLVGTLATGPVRHELLVGVDAVRFRQTSRSAYDFAQHLGGGVPSLDVYDPVYTGYTPPPLTADPKQVQEHVGLYVQDSIELGPRWVVLAGLRHDRVEDELEGRGTEESDATTGRLGLLWAGDGGWSPYVSYSESFTPVAGTSFYDERFEPLEGAQVEAGVKYQPPGRGYRVSVAAFELRERNRLIADPQNPQNRLQAGETESAGAELEVAGQLGRLLDVTAHYNYLDNDEELDALPEHQAGLWANRTIRLGAFGSLDLGLGVRYFSDFRDGTAPVVPELTLFDALVGWERGDWRLAVNAQNLEDEVYASTCLPRGDCFYGSRRTVTVTTGTRF